MHPKVIKVCLYLLWFECFYCIWTFFQPEPEPERKNSLSEKKSSSPNHNGEAAEESGHVPSEYIVQLIQKSDMITNDNVVVDTNLIQLDTDDLASNTNNTYADNDDDLIFEVGKNFVFCLFI